MNHIEPFQIAADFIKYTQCSIFLTGKAGTGKTTFLKYIKEHVSKNTAIIAPTGVAAMNAEGTTIHSFFQLPFTPYIPVKKEVDAFANKTANLVGGITLTKERKEVLQQLDLLIIDEVSMVRCDMLDAIDDLLRQVRRQKKAFGGIQLLLIGDMYQLSPVVREDDWKILSGYYKGPYFFNSYVLEIMPPVCIELSKVYRQKDLSFISILNQVRNNSLDQQGFALLHSRYMPGFKPATPENYITLTTHNSKADSINCDALLELPDQLYNFDASVFGDFPEKNFPANLKLQLKVGAQVMFIKNDTEKIRRYFNGKIGKVAAIEDDKIIITCMGDSIPIEVKKEKWRNIRYLVNQETQLIEEDEIGSFTQFPLRLAWAITIHKSQGLTFEKAVIDVGGAFAPGQVYVALSRCTSLEGIVLHSRITNGSLKNDSRIDAFLNSHLRTSLHVKNLNEAKRKFQQYEINRLFDFEDHLVCSNALVSFIATQPTHFTPKVTSYIEGLHQSVHNIAIIGSKFKPQLNYLLEQNELPEENPALQSRVMAASGHFIAALQSIKNTIQQGYTEPGNILAERDFTGLVLKLFNTICKRLYFLKGCLNGFNVEAYLLYKRTFVSPVLATNFYFKKVSDGSFKNPHPKLYELLLYKRETLCAQFKKAVRLIASNISIEEMSTYLPQTYDDLCQITGFGPVRTKKYGEPFLNVIGEYCEQHNLQSNIAERLANRKKIKKNRSGKPDSKTTTFNLHSQGKSMKEIARVRQMSLSTIESHLAYFAGLGSINIDSIISLAKQDQIRSALKKYGSPGMKKLKEKLPEDVSYGEIRIMMALQRLAL